MDESANQEINRPINPEEIHHNWIAKQLKELQQKASRPVTVGDVLSGDDDYRRRVFIDVLSQFAAPAIGGQMAYQRDILWSGLQEKMALGFEFTRSNVATVLDIGRELGNGNLEKVVSQGQGVLEKGAQFILDQPLVAKTLESCTEACAQLKLALATGDVIGAITTPSRLLENMVKVTRENGQTEMAILVATAAVVWAGVTTYKGVEQFKQQVLPEIKKMKTPPEEDLRKMFEEKLKEMVKSKLDFVGVKE